MDVLRCHLPLIVPAGDVGLRSGNDTRSWQRGRCLIFDDTFEHEAWNRGDGDRVVLLVTFERPAKFADREHSVRAGATRRR
jgi:beta-hydroxylase